MLPDRWYAVLDSKELGRRPLAAMRLGERLVFFRNTHGEPACLAEQCAHRGASLALGQVRGECVACPFHGFQFDAQGRCRLIPANGRAGHIPETMRVRAFPAREAHGFIWIFTGAPREDLPPVPWFEGLDERFSCGTLRSEWAVDYTRAIENQLDVPHVPIVHRTTIGRRSGTVVDGPPTRLVDDKLEIWPAYRDDAGRPAEPQAEIPAVPPMLTFLFPNIWQIRLGEKVRNVIAFAPVDEAHTVLYLRNYQRLVRIPGLRWLVNWFNGLANRVILDQDKRVVLTQRPLRTELKMGEKLVSADKPIILFRKRREELLGKASVTPPSA
jgi:phenylpropionate dioxygenase-like ring-hydroxylating dioxygenase large terminal subunit